MRNIDEKLGTSRFFSLMKVTDLRREMLPYIGDAYNLNIYEIVEDGVLKVSHGAVGRTKKDNNMFFDVTGLSKVFHSTYAPYITEMVVSKVIGEPSKEEEFRPGRIVGILPLDGIYCTLGKTALEDLGRDYVRIINRPEGIQIENELSVKNMRDGIYLRVGTKPLMDETVEKISGELIELIQMENGLYKVAGENVQPGKDYK